MTSIYRIGIPVFAVLGFLLLAAPAASQRRPECRAMETDVNGRRETQRMCRGTDGVWRPEHRQEPADALPAGFRGRVSYSGTHEARVTTAGPPIRRLDVRNLIRSATGGRSRDYAGAYNIEITFDGNALSARFSGTGGMSTGTASGTRSGSRCRLIDDRYGTVTEAECTSRRFAGTARSLRGQRQQMTARLDANATRIIDAAQVERERQIAEAAAREQARRLAALRAQNDRIVHGNGPLPRRLEALAEIDSRSWLVFTYTPGSMTNVRRENVRNARNYTAVGNFRYGDGRPGELQAQVANGAFQCLKFANEPACRPLGNPQSRDIARDVFIGLIEEAVSGDDR
jgi:hypothetical protein